MVFRYYESECYSNCFAPEHDAGCVFAAFCTAPLGNRLESRQMRPVCYEYDQMTAPIWRLKVRCVSVRCNASDAVPTCFFDSDGSSSAFISRCLSHAPEQVSVRRAQDDERSGGQAVRFRADAFSHGSLCSSGHCLSQRAISSRKSPLRSHSALQQLCSEGQL